MRRTDGKRGFTLVELLVVITIISLLVGILVPVVGTAIKLMGFMRVQARVVELGAGCVSYYQDFNYYPGQRHAEQLKGSSPAGLYTGSQILAADLFAYVYTKIPDTALGSPTSATKFAPYRSGDVDKVLDGGTYKAVQYSSSAGYNGGLGLPFTLLDRNDDSLALLYFPARLDGDATKTDANGMFRYLDNADYIEDDVVFKNYMAANGKPSSYTKANYVIDMKAAFVTAIAGNTSYKTFGCVIVAAGMKRTYLDSSDWAAFPR